MIKLTAEVTLAVGGLSDVPFEMLGLVLGRTVGAGAIAKRAEHRRGHRRVVRARCAARIRKLAVVPGVARASQRPCYLTGIMYPDEASPRRASGVARVADAWRRWLGIRRQRAELGPTP